MIMQTYRGKSVFGGVAVGKICVYQKGEQTVKRTKIENTEQEKARFNAAVQESIRQLGELYEKAVKEVGEANASIFEIHQIMLEDEDYLDAVQNIIDTQKVNAEYAVAVTGDNFAQMFAAMEDEYMRGRAADVKDISERIVRVLSGGAGQGIHTDEPVIILADDLAPSETVQLEKDKVLSFVTVHGSVNSHTAILARTMSIPALIGTDVALDETVDGKFAVVDGTNGVLYVEPDEETLETMRRRQREEQEKKELLQTLKGRETVTLDGKKIRLSQPQQMMAQDRKIVEEAYAGDIIGVFDPGIFSIGDTLCTGEKVEFEGIPTFAPEHFARVRQMDTMKRKQFIKGISQIAQEGAIQIFQEYKGGMEEIIVGVVGVLQFDVLKYRLENEYNVDIRLENLPYEHIRWIANKEEINLDRIQGTSDMKKVMDLKGNPLLLFVNPWSVGMVQDRNKDLVLTEFSKN